MSDIPTTFDLSPPKEDADAATMLKWMVAVMDQNDRSLMFAASLLANCIEWRGLTEKQSQSGSRVYQRIRDLFERGLLEIQGGGGVARKDNGPTNVTHLNPNSRRGGAA